ncbi:MAG TPA: TonB family protein [bacterium]|nr:TonB family protein [bacterium]
MNSALSRPADRRLALGLSIALHLCLLLLFGKALLMAPPPSTVIFSVETVSGITPQGEGSGAPGSAHQMTDKSANRNPLAGGLRLAVTDAPLPQAAPKTSKSKAHSAPKTELPPSLGDLDKRYDQLKIGVQPRDFRPGDEPSEGGMGNAHHVGTEDGGLGLEGPIAGRGYRIGDYSFGKPLPEESEVQLLVTVGPQGEVLEARVKKTSGYPELDQHALAKAREILFDALPAGASQDPVTGTVIFDFQYNGKMK